MKHSHRIAFVGLLIACGSVVPASAKGPTIQTYKPPAYKRPVARPSTPVRKPNIQSPYRPPAYQPPRRSTPSTQFRQTTTSTHRTIPGYNPGSGPVRIPRQGGGRGQSRPHVHHPQGSSYHGGYYYRHVPAPIIVVTPPTRERPPVRGQFRRQDTPANNHPNNPQLPNRLSLSRGDVILTINGQSIRSADDCIRAVNRSPHVMAFTFRDNSNGIVWSMQTHLRNGGSRFGINVNDNGGDGALVTRIFRGYPATNNQVVGRVNN